MEKLEDLELPFDKKFTQGVTNLELSVRSAKCLKNENIFYIGDLVQKSEKYMLGVPNFGHRSLNEIKYVLSQMGLCLGMEIVGWNEWKEKAYQEEYEWRRKLIELSDYIHRRIDNSPDIVELIDEITAVLRDLQDSISETDSSS